jgi:hypothetical protein
MSRESQFVSNGPNASFNLKRAEKLESKLLI